MRKLRVIEMQLSDDMQKALKECAAYNRMGGLDENVMRDIAFDHDVDFERLEQAFYEGE